MISQALIPELLQEAKSTRRILERVPQDKFDWKPHEKSMTLGRLATHIAEITRYVAMVLETEGIDMSNRDYTPTRAESSEELLSVFDKHLEEAKAALEKASDEDFMKTWTMRNGEHVIFSLPKVATIRTLAMNHLLHHRGQLSVYLRLLNVSVPGMYGPSADEGFSR